jgi:cytochrome P450
VLLSADPPIHNRQRRLVNDAFKPRRVRTLEPAIHDIAHELVDGFVGADEIELNAQFAAPLPLTVIAAALNVPRDELPTFKRWSDAFVVANANPG